MNKTGMTSKKPTTTTQPHRSRQAHTVGDCQHVLKQEFEAYCEQMNVCIQKREELDSHLSDLIRATIEDLRQRRRQLPETEKPSWFKKMSCLLASLYYLSPLGKLFNPHKYEMAWKVLKEIKEQSFSETASV